MNDKTEQEKKQMSGAEIIQALNGAINELVGIVNKQRQDIEENRVAIQTVITWVGGELGEEAVGRLADLLNVRLDPDAANENQCEHGKDMTDYCIECGRVNGST